MLPTSPKQRSADSPNFRAAGAQLINSIHRSFRLGNFSAAYGRSDAQGFVQTWRQLFPRNDIAIPSWLG